MNGIVASPDYSWIAQNRLKPARCLGQGFRCYKLHKMALLHYSKRYQRLGLDRAFLSRVEDGRGGLGHLASPRFPSPLIKPDVRISRIRLSD